MLHNISLKRIIAVVIALMKLHNFFINESVADEAVLELFAQDNNILIQMLMVMLS